jgi:DNA-binding CsgD family transcriptional regulator
MSPSADAPADPLVQRRMVAGLCRIIGDTLNPRSTGPAADGPAPGRPSGQESAATTAVPLSPRMRQTLERLLAGDSEKEIAARLGLSPHTVHVYVKTVYRRFDVCSRGELFARFIDRQNLMVGRVP